MGAETLMLENDFDVERKVLSVMVVLLVAVGLAASAVLYLVCR